MQMGKRQSQVSRSQVKIGKACEFDLRPMTCRPADLDCI